jgi:hypothetical protein
MTPFVIRFWARCSASGSRQRASSRSAQTMTAPQIATEADRDRDERRDHLRDRRQAFWAPGRISGDAGPTR